jgi:hypothetical protein
MEASPSAIRKGAPPSSNRQGIAPLVWQSVFPDVGSDGSQEEKNFFETRIIEYQNGGALGWK